MEHVMIFRRSTLTSMLMLIFCGQVMLAADDPLPSWNEGPAKKAITDFVARVTQAGSPDFVKTEERVATFDNDGCLWAEQPMYFQGLFAFDRIKALAPQHPEWKDAEPYKSVLANDMKGV